MYETEEFRQFEPQYVFVIEEFTRLRYDELES